MAIFKAKESDYSNIVKEGKRHWILTPEMFAKFDVSLLGLGDLTRPATATDAIAAVFDLEGFTNFCKQIDPELSVPLFLSEFLAWLMQQVKEEMVIETDPSGVSVYSPLPFFVKFMGDGILVLWDASSMGEIERRNVIVTARSICRNYETVFVPAIEGKVVDPPPILRCGLARGRVYSVGDGNDFVGSCINMSARLQRMPGLTFAFNRRGFLLEDKNLPDWFRNEIVIKRVSIRGIGESELIAIIKVEFEALQADEKKRFRPPTGKL